MVVDGDVEQLAGFDETFGDSDVFTARRRVAAGVIVREDHRRGRMRDGFLEHFPRLDEAGVDRADGDAADADEPVLGVEQKYPEDFPVLRPEFFPDTSGSLDSAPCDV